MVGFPLPREQGIAVPWRQIEPHQIFYEWQFVTKEFSDEQWRAVEAWNSRVKRYAEAWEMCRQFSRIIHVEDERWSSSAMRLLIKLSAPSESVQVFSSLNDRQSISNWISSPSSAPSIMLADRYGILHSRIICFPENRRATRHVKPGSISCRLLMAAYGQGERFSFTERRSSNSFKIQLLEHISRPQNKLSWAVHENVSQLKREESVGSVTSPELRRGEPSSLRSSHHFRIQSRASTLWEFTKRNRTND